VITVERLSKRFADLQTGGFTALDDVSFDVHLAKFSVCSGRMVPAKRPACDSQHGPAAHQWDCVCRRI